jgi:hypothetical protein
MSVGAAFRDGWGRLRRAPVLVAATYGLTLLMAIPPALLLREAIARHLGSSLAAEGAASGVNFDWWNEFLAQASGLGQTFTPSVIGFAAVLKNLSAMADSASLAPTLALITAAHLAGSIFLLGGVLDRLARDRATGAHGFFAACGVFLFRFMRLAIVAGAVYAALFVWLHQWLFDDLYVSWTRDVTVERTAFAIRVALYVLFALIVLAVNLLVDYAKIRMVVEDRRSAIGSLGAALRFLRRQQSAAFGLYLLNTAAFLALLVFYAAVASEGAPTWTSLVVGQLYIIARIVLRTQFAASQIGLFQGRLAHAGYTAAPVPVWPDSAAAEAIRPQ